MSWKKRFCILYRKSEEKSYGNIQRTFHSCIGVKHHMMTTAFFCFCLFHSKTMTGISLKRVHRMIISAHSCFKYTKMHKLLKLTKCLCLLKMHCMRKKKFFVPPAIIIIPSLCSNMTSCIHIRGSILVHMTKKKL